MIKIDHLSKKYNDNVVLDDISLEIKQGDVVGIIGPSGTGKSTLLRCVNRLETPEKGTVTIGDKVIGLSERKPKELLYLRQNTGMVFQRFNLFEKNRTGKCDGRPDCCQEDEKRRGQSHCIRRTETGRHGKMGKPLSETYVRRTAAEGGARKSPRHETADSATRRADLSP